MTNLVNINKPKKSDRNILKIEAPKPQEEKPKEEEGFWKAPGSDISKANQWLQERGINALQGLDALIQGRPAPTRQPSQERLGTLPWILDQAGSLPFIGPRLIMDLGEDIGRWATGAPGLPTPNERISSYFFPRTALTTSSWQRPPGMPEIGGGGPSITGAEQVDEGVVEEPFVDWYAQAQALLGGGPNYGAYRQALTDQAASLNAQIQAMYNQLGEQAGANVARLQDIYGGAQTGVGDIYNSAAGNVEQAYQSAQQQAADQMARLGIEEAAAQTIPFTASQQAQALAGLEQGRAGGLSALQRYGASAQDFGSQMAQVAQQQGTEMNAALLNSLQRMLAESLGAEAQGAYDARLRAPGLARDLYEASQIGRQQPLSIEDQLAMDAAASRQAQASADYFVQIGRLRNETLQTLLDAGYDYEEALAEVNLQYPMPIM